MAAQRPTYPIKSNDPSDAENVRKFLADDANELADIANDHATLIDTLLEAAGIDQGINSVGEFISLVVLQASYPDGADGSYAIIDDGLGGVPQVATYNDATSLWEMTVPDAPIVFLVDYSALPGTGIANTLYLALDSGLFYYWNNGQYFQAALYQPTRDLNTYIDINSTNIKMNQKVMGVHPNINGGGFFIGFATQDDPVDDSGVTKYLEQ